MMFSCLGLVKSWMYMPIYLSISAHIKCLVIITETEQLQPQKGRTNEMDAERPEMHCVGKQPTNCSLIHYLLAVTEWAAFTPHWPSSFVGSM